MKFAQPYTLGNIVLLAIATGEPLPPGFAYGGSTIWRNWLRLFDSTSLAAQLCYNRASARTPRRFAGMLDGYEVLPHIGPPVIVQRAVL